ncbi:hypothetical protein SKAU_G00284140 [Synaphobranchus kaupii]|uniref:Uncharacterized protein n=1 Tax=Synaphobranchus kaupii TaxID=118154 RepID=A0A9Q1EXL8_SYNKA|nr:hypothetical protein SKAU_G00284140 [Synaphobranchus kaupii]
MERGAKGKESGPEKEPEPGPSTDRAGEDLQGEPTQQETEEQAETEASGTGGIDVDGRDVMENPNVDKNVDVAEGEDQPGNVNSGALSRQIGEQNREDGKSNEDSSEPQVSSSPQVEAPVAAEEGEWSREGTEADPDEEMSFDEEDFFSEFSQTGRCRGLSKDAALQAGNSLHIFIQGGVTRLKDLMHLEKGCWKPAVELAETLAVRSVRVCEQFLWRVKGCLPPSVLELIEETLTGGIQDSSGLRMPYNLGGTSLYSLSRDG